MTIASPTTTSGDGERDRNSAKHLADSVAAEARNDTRLMLVALAISSKDRRESDGVAVRKQSVKTDAEQRRRQGEAQTECHRPSSEICAGRSRRSSTIAPIIVASSRRDSASNESA